MVAAATEPAFPTTRAVLRRSRKEPIRVRVMSYLPRGNLLDDQAWRSRHHLLLGFLLLHLPALTLFGLFMERSPIVVAYAVTPVPVLFALGLITKQRRLASFFVSAGIVYCSAALVVLSGGMIEAHFHFFIIIGFIALYQDWVPFIWDVAFTSLSHGLGSAFRSDLMFNHHHGQINPWAWSAIHGVAVLAACVGMIIYWRHSEDEQQKALDLIRVNEIGAREIGRRKFTSELLVNLARRNQSMLYRQLDIINQLENKERDPDALAELFRLDHLATRIRRNAESLLVLSGEEPPRVWSTPVRLTDVVRAAIAETEDLDRVAFVVDERLAVLGHAVTDLTHLLAELIENAVRSSPPGSRVTIRSTPDVRQPGAVVLTVEDWGVGMRSEDLAEANAVLAQPRDVDAVVSGRLGLLVVSRLAHRYSIQVTLTSTSGTGITAVALLPAAVFAPTRRPAGAPSAVPSGASPMEPRRTWPPAAEDDVPPLVPPAIGRQRAQMRQAPHLPPPGLSPNGHSSNGHSPNGHLSNGHSSNGHSSDGHSSDGHSSDGQFSNGSSWNGLHAPGVPALGPPSQGEQPALPQAEMADWDGWWAEEQRPALPADRQLEQPVVRMVDLRDVGIGTPPDPARHNGFAPPAELPAEPQQSWPSRPELVRQEPMRQEPARQEALRQEYPRPEIVRQEPPRPELMRQEPVRQEPVRQEPRPEFVRPEPVRTETVRPEPLVTVDHGPNGAPNGTVRLSRRTPQSHLAPELQRGAAAPVDDSPTPPSIPAQPPDAVRAREALSRYQASRQAAISDHDAGKGRPS